MEKKRKTQGECARQAVAFILAALLGLSAGGAGETATFLDLRAVKPGLPGANVVYLVPLDANGVALCDPNGMLKPYPTVSVPAGTYVLDVAGMEADGDKPRCAALTKTGADYHLGVLTFDPNAGIYTSKTRIDGAMAPFSLVTNDGATYYVGDSGAATIGRYDWNGTTYTATAGVAAANVSAIAVDSSGILYFSGSNAIYKNDGVTSSLISSGALGFDSTTAVAVDSSGHIYVTGIQGTGARMKKFTLSGTQVTSFPWNNFDLSWGSGTPSIATDGKWIYAARGGEQRKYSAWTGADALFGQTTHPAGTSLPLPAPYRIYADANGFFGVLEVEVGGQMVAVLEKYTPQGLADGAFAPQIFSGGADDVRLGGKDSDVLVSHGNTLYGFDRSTGKSAWKQAFSGSPLAYAIDRWGTLCLGTGGGNDDVEFRTFKWVDGQWVQQSSLGTREGISGGVAVDSSGYIYVGTSLGGISRYADGGWTQYVPNRQTGSYRDLARDPAGSVPGGFLVIDSSGRVDRYWPCGDYRQTFFGPAGAGIAVDPLGGIYIAGTDTNCIFRYDNDWAVLPFTFQPPGTTPAPTSAPTAVPTPLPTPKTPLPTPAIVVIGGTPAASPAPLPTEVTPIPTGKPGPNVKLPEEFLRNLLGPDADLSLVEFVQVEGNKMSCFLPAGFTMMRIDVTVQRTEEGSVSYSHALFVLQLNGEWTPLGSDSSFGAARARLLLQQGMIADNGSQDWNPTPGVVELRQTTALLAAPKTTPVASPSAAPSISPSASPTGSHFSQGGGCSVGSVATAIPFLLLVFPFLWKRR